MTYFYLIKIEAKILSLSQNISLLSEFFFVLPYGSFIHYFDSPKPVERFCHTIVVALNAASSIVSQF